MDTQAETAPHNHPHEPPESIIASGPPEHLATCSLVLNAVGIKHSLDLRRSSLLTPSGSADAARYHLKQYFEENANWPEVPQSLQIEGQPGNPPTILLIGMMALFFIITGPWDDASQWFTAGAIDSHGVLDNGEWWRLVTALTLHADQVHLLGNCIIGGFLVHLLSKTVGSGLGWFALITCGALGNYLNIAARDTVHHSVGFSTSIFAAIGIFSGLQILAGKKNLLKNLIIPLGAGAGLLALLGVEGERTDIGAHFFGFVCGLGFGIAIRHFNMLRHSVTGSLQEKLLVLTMSIVGICWVVAWS